MSSKPSVNFGSNTKGSITNISGGGNENGFGGSITGKIETQITPSTSIFGTGTVSGGGAWSGPTKTDWGVGVGVRTTW